MAVREIIAPESNSYFDAAKEVVKFSDSELAIVDDLRDTMRHMKMSSISAPRIGASKRIVIISSLQCKDGSSVDEVVMINPLIVDGFGDMLCQEFDYEINDLKMVQRAYMVIVAYQDEKGDQKEVLFSGIQSASAQYEIDRLERC